MSEYQIRKLEPEDFHLLIPLMQDCFDASVNVAYFKWKFVDNPAGFVVGFIAIADDGEVAAYYGAIPEQYSINGELATIFQSCDTMTHSRHRRKGLFQKLATRCYTYLNEQSKLFVIGFGGGNSTPGFYKFGWKYVFSVHHYFYPKAFVHLRVGKRVDRNVKEVTDCATIEQSILKSNSYRPIHSHKSLQNFRWRTSNPLYDYKTIMCSEKDGQNSWLTYYITTGRIVLFDFYFAGGPGGKALIGYLKNILASSQNKGIIAFCQERSIYSKMLAIHGFIYNPFNKGPLSYKTPFVIYADEKRLSEYTDSSKWLVNSFDYDAM